MEAQNQNNNEEDDKEPDVKEGSSSSSARKQQIQLIANTSSVTGNSSRQIIPTIVESDNIRTVPPQFQHCEMHDVIALVAAMLDRLIVHNDAFPSTLPLTRFHSKAAPGITPLAYLTRITTFTNVDPSILLILLYYIDRVNAYMAINSLTVHRFLISAICCGCKALSDSFATNSRYAKVGGVELVEMNALEREFLLALNWRLATSGALLDQYWRSLVEAHPAYRLAAPPASPSLLKDAPLPPPDSTSASNPSERPHKRPKG